MSGLTGRQKRPPKPKRGEGLASPDRLALSRVVSSPNLVRLASRTDTAPNASERASSLASLDILEDEPLDLREAVRNVMDDLVDKLRDAKRRQTGTALARFHTTLVSQDLYRRVMLDPSLEWRIESCLGVLEQMLVRGRNAKPGASLVEAIRAARCILFLLISVRNETLHSNVTGSAYESILKTCIGILPRPQSEEKLQSQPNLIWLACLLIGELNRLQLVEETLTEELKQELGISAMYYDWSDYFQGLTARVVRRKQREIKAIGSSGADIALSWSSEDVVLLDGVCVGLSSLLMSLPSSVTFNRNGTGRFAYIWGFVRDLGEILRFGTADMINMYFSSMPSDLLRPKSGTVLLGLPSFLGIVYESWWEIPRGEDDLLDAARADASLLGVMEMFAGRASSADARQVNKNISKEILKVFRDLCETIETGKPPETISVNLRKDDVQDGTVEVLGQRLIGETLEIGKWRSGHLLRLAREFGGRHGSLALALGMEEGGAAHAFAGLANEEKKDRNRRHVINKKLSKMERQREGDQKRAQQNGLA